MILLKGLIFIVFSKGLDNINISNIKNFNRNIEEEQPYERIDLRFKYTHYLQNIRSIFKC